MVVTWLSNCSFDLRTLKVSDHLKSIVFDCSSLQASQHNTQCRTWHCIYIYIRGFRACQHLRSLAPIMNDYDGQMIFGDLGGLKFPDICLTSEEKPRKKTSPRKLVLTGDRTRARCMTGVHATTWPTAVDLAM